MSKRNTGARHHQPSSKWSKQFQEAENTGIQKPPPLAPVIEKCPIINENQLLSIDDYEIQSEALHKDLVTWAGKLHNVDREYLALEVELIRIGHLSLGEHLREIAKLLPAIATESDRAIVRGLLEWHKRTSLKKFWDRYAKMMLEVTPGTKQLILAASEPPLEDLISKEERIMAATLDLLGSNMRNHYYHRRRDLLSRCKPETTVNNRRQSMLPTMWDKSDSLTFPVHPTNETNVLDKLRRGNVVGFIVFFQNGNTKFFCKRVVGLPGYHVQSIEGKTLQVPPGCFWATGDNPEQSHDSRHFGAVPANNLRQIYRFVYTFDTWASPRLRFL